jgi:integrase
MASGHVEKRYKTSYTIVINAGVDALGNRIRIVKSVKVKKKTDAEQIMRQMLAEIDQGTYIQPSTMLFSDYLDKWLEYAKDNLAHKTYKRYQGIINNYFRPEMGHIQLCQISPLHLQNHYSWALSSEDGHPGLAQNTVRKHHNLLHRALGQAKQWRMIRENPADFVDPPSIEKPDIKALSNADEICTLYDATRGTMLYIPVLLATAGGLRRGEICGLCWQDVNWETGRIYVRHSLERVTGEGLKPKKTKSEKGRPVALPKAVLEILRRNYFTRYEGDDLGGHNEDYLCSWEDGRPIAPDYITSEFSKLADKLKLNVTFHGLRHTHNTLLLRYNVNPKLVADRSGHDIKLAMDQYSHVMPDMQDSVANLLDQVLFPPTKDEDENGDKKK